MSITHIALSHSLFWPSLRSLSLHNWMIVIFALLAGGLVKGIVSIGVPLIAIPLLTGILSVKQAVLLISIPIIIGNIPQALEGGQTWHTKILSQCLTKLTRLDGYLARANDPPIGADPPTHRHSIRSDDRRQNYG